MRAAHDRRHKLHLVRLLEVTHAKDPAALQAKWLAELAPASAESPFDLLWAKVMRERETQS